MKTEKNNILTILFWLNFSVFAIHVVEETVLQGGLVVFVHKYFWSGFKLTDFFQANAIWLIAIAFSNILYDILGNRLAFIMAIPMIFLWERCFNTLSHLLLTFYCNDYCPGLLTGLLFLVILYFMVRFAVLPGHMKWSTLLISCIPALIFETVFVSSMWWAH